MWTPTDAILRSPTHTPTCLWPRLVCASRPASASAATIERSIVRMYSGHAADAHDRVADELPGAVVGELAAARRAHDVDPALAVEGLAERQLVLVRAAADGVDRRMLEQQHQLGELALAHPVAQALLQRGRLAVLDPAQSADPQLHAPRIDSALPAATGNPVRVRGWRATVIARMPAPWEPSLRPPRPGMDGVGAVLPGESSLTRGEEDSHEGSCNGGRDSCCVGRSRRPLTRAMKRRRGLPPGAAPTGCAGCSSRTAPASAGSGSPRSPRAGCIPPTCASATGRARRSGAQADWAASGAGPRGTDLARSLLAAHAAGIDPTLITAERNFVAETLALFDGRRLYDPGAASSLVRRHLRHARAGRGRRAAADPRRAGGVPALAADRDRRLELHRGRGERVGGHDRRRRRRAVRGRACRRPTRRSRRRSRSCASARTR